MLLDRFHKLLDVVVHSETVAFRRQLAVEIDSRFLTAIPAFIVIDMNGSGRVVNLRVAREAALEKDSSALRIAGNLHAGILMIFPQVDVALGAGGEPFVEVLLYQSVEVGLILENTLIGVGLSQPALGHMGHVVGILKLTSSLAAVTSKVHSTLRSEF